MLNPDMRADELRLHMGELDQGEDRVARAAIAWANREAEHRVAELEARLAAVKEARREAEDRYYRVHGNDNLAEVFVSFDAALSGSRALAVVEAQVGVCGRTTKYYGVAPMIPVDAMAGDTVTVVVLDASGKE